jgi:hypothetical protein
MPTSKPKPPYTTPQVADMLNRSTSGVRAIGHAHNLGTVIAGVRLWTDMDVARARVLFAQPRKPRSRRIDTP